MWRQPTYSCTRSSTSASSAGRATPRAGPRTACAQARRPGRGGRTPPGPPRRSGAAGGCLWGWSCCAYGVSISRRTESRSSPTPEAPTSARRWSRDRPALTPSHTHTHTHTHTLTHTHTHTRRPCAAAPPLSPPFRSGHHDPTLARARGSLRRDCWLRSNIASPWSRSAPFAPSPPRSRLGRCARSGWRESESEESESDGSRSARALTYLLWPSLLWLSSRYCGRIVCTMAILARSASGGRRSAPGERPGERRSVRSGIGSARRGARWRGRRGC